MAEACGNRPDDAGRGVAMDDAEVTNRLMQQLQTVPRDKARQIVDALSVRLHEDASH